MPSASLLVYTHQNTNVCHVKSSGSSDPILYWIGEQRQTARNMDLESHCTALIRRGRMKENILSIKKINNKK